MKSKYEIFMGRLGANPDLRYTGKSEPVCRLTVAVDVEGEEKPEWKKVIVWGKQGELCHLYLKKGNTIFVQGRLTIREFRDENGGNKTIKEWRANLVGFPNS